MLFILDALIVLSLQNIFLITGSHNPSGTLVGNGEHKLENSYCGPETFPLPL